MSEIKITSVQPNGSFVYQNGPLAGKTGFGFIYTFEDGTTGRCTHMTEQPKFSIGDSVVVAEDGNDPQGNRKVKLSKPGSNYGGGSGGGNSYDGGIGAMVGNAITNAVNLIRDGKAKPNKGEDLAACLIRLGDQICIASETLKKKHTPAAPQPAPQPAQQNVQTNQGQYAQTQPAQPVQQDQQGTFEEDDVPF
jgi:hypothetical protein